MPLAGALLGLLGLLGPAAAKPPPGPSAVPRILQLSYAKQYCRYGKGVAMLAGVTVR